MQAIDTNILVHALVESNPRHGAAVKVLRELAEGPLPWAIPWPCIYEYLRVVTHPRVFHPPVPLNIAQEALRKVLASPSLTVLAETNRHADLLDQTLRQSGATGNLIHDAHIVALCIEHGVSALITGDRDFSRFTGLKFVNPFATP